jgi:hypothetical protein
LHCLLLDAESFDKQFVLASGSIPTGPTKQVIDRVFRSAVEQRRTDESMSSFQSEILDILKDINFHQRLKTDEQRIEKILTDDAISYFEFLKNSRRFIGSRIDFNIVFLAFYSTSQRRNRDKR